MDESTMKLSASQQERLARVGFRPIPMPDELPETSRIARVVAQHRVGYELHDGETSFDAQPAVRFLERGRHHRIVRPAVGDFVVFTPGSPPVIEHILPRRTELKRGAAGALYQPQTIATNFDSVFVLCGLDGDFNPARIERYLVIIESSGAKPIVVLTKADTVNDFDRVFAKLRGRIPLNIEIVAINGKSADSVAPLLSYLGPGDTALLVGSSGAGKSTLTNTLLGQSRQETTEVRANDSRGRHTTTHRALIQLPSGGCLIDTPGMREVKLIHDNTLDESQFADIDALARSCRFGNCGHRSEPGCAVRPALADGRIHASRWHSYVKLRDELAAAANAQLAQDRKRGAARASTRAPHRRPR
jgi:ribosome biogenesis GTPase